MDRDNCEMNSKNNMYFITLPYIFSVILKYKIILLIIPMITTVLITYLTEPRQQVYATEALMFFDDLDRLIKFKSDNKNFEKIGSIINIDKAINERLTSERVKKILSFPLRGKNIVRITAKGNENEDVVKIANIAMDMMIEEMYKVDEDISFSKDKIEMIQSKIDGIVRKIKLVKQSDAKKESTMSSVDYIMHNFIMKAEFSNAQNYSLNMNVHSTPGLDYGRFNLSSNSFALTILLETLAYAKAAMFIYQDNIERFKAKNNMNRIKSVLRTAGPSAVKIKSKWLNKSIAYYIFTLSVLLLFVMVFQVIRDVSKVGD